MPDRIDGMMMTDGNRANAYRTEVFNDEYNRMKTGGTDLDRVNFTVSQYFYNNRGGGNYRGLVSGLVDAGLRAPIGAFPPAGAPRRFAIRCRRGCSSRG